MEYPIIKSGYPEQYKNIKSKEFSTGADFTINTFKSAFLLANEILNRPCMPETIIIKELYFDFVQYLSPLCSQFYLCDEFDYDKWEIIFKAIDNGELIKIWSLGA